MAASAPKKIQEPEPFGSDSGSTALKKKQENSEFTLQKNLYRNYVDHDALTVTLRLPKLEHPKNPFKIAQFCFKQFFPIQENSKHSNMRHFYEVFEVFQFSFNVPSCDFTVLHIKLRSKSL